MALKKCNNCGRELESHAKGMCITCYKKFFWKPKKIICKRCKREMPHHSKGLCAGCYNFVFHLDKTKNYNNKKRHNLSSEVYKNVTSKCILCDFDKIVELHHLDENSKNSSIENFVGLCPNHHKMFHDFRYKSEIIQLLEEKQIKVPPNLKLEFNKSNLST